MGRIYKNIASEQKVNYWMTVSNILIICITFWFGLYVQDIIAKKNADASSVLANAEYNAKVKPLIDSLEVKYGSIILDIFVANDEIAKGGCDTSAVVDSVFNRFDNNMYDDILYTFYSVKGYAMDKKKDTIVTDAFLLPFLTVIYNDAMYFHDSVMSKNPNTKWEDGWQYVSKHIEDMLRSSQFIERHGIFRYYYTDPSMKDRLKEIYSTVYRNGDFDQGIFRIKYFVVLESTKILVWLSNHKYFETYKEKTWRGTIKEIFHGELAKVLLFVLVIGFVLAYVVSLLLPRQRLQSETEKQLIEISKTLKSMATKNKTAIKVIEMPDPFEDICIHNYEELYNSEQKYVSQLMNLLKENDIEIPPKEE